MKKIAIHQPNFIPHIGFFNKIKEVDTFVLLDDVQFTKGNWINRTIFKNKEDYIYSVPVKYDFGMPINLVPIDNYSFFKKKLLKNIKQNYKEYYQDFENILKEDFVFLSELNIAFIRYFVKKMNIDTKIILSSSLNIDKSICSSKLILQINKILKSDIYITGMGGNKYLNVKSFNENLIHVEFKDFLIGSSGTSIINDYGY